MNMFYSKLRWIIRCHLLIIIAVWLSSCLNTQKATYFNRLEDTTLLSIHKLPETKIRTNDIISVSVSSLNPDATVIFNTPNIIAGPNGTQFNGYLVNEAGLIEFPVLGLIGAAGFTKDQLKASIANALVSKKLLLDPIVTIRIQNFRVTVLGEVKSPGVIQVPSEKISLLEAIGLAGDLTIFAKRENVLIIREDSTSKIIKRLDLNSNEIFASPYYYLKSNDIVYIEPNKARVASASRAQQWMPVLFALLSFAVIVLDRVIE